MTSVSIGGDIQIQNYIFYNILVTISIILVVVQKAMDSFILDDILK